MPTSESILAGLVEIANRWQALAITWHIYFGVLAAALIGGLRPSRRLAGVLLGVPLVSVSALAWATPNPFNGVVFALLALALIAIAIRLPNEQVEIAPWWATWPGVALVVVGWVYPHFLDTSTFVTYLYAAPVGTIPCPTLIMVTGFALILACLQSRAWAMVLGGTGVFYGLFGAARLGVALDWILLAGSVALIAYAVAQRKGPMGR